MHLTRATVLLGAAILLAACSDRPQITETEAGADQAFSPTDAPLLSTGARRAIPGQYIVVLQPGAEAASVAARIKVQPQFTYTSVLNGFSARLSQAQLASIRKDKRVRYVEQDAVASITQEPGLPGGAAPSSTFLPLTGGGVQTAQASATWGIDRTDQKLLPRDNTYRYTNRGTGVRVYILDTGIKTTHGQFGGRAVAGAAGFDAIGDGQNGQDCNGHGTHVAGTVGGATYGIAKSVSLTSVRVLNCAGNGAWSGIIAGIDWVTNKHVKPAVANMSLGGLRNAAVNEAVQRSIAFGVTYVIAAGNNNWDACDFSPSSTPEAITVGATDITDTRASFSNFGTCVDLFAPGVNITSAWYTSTTAINTINGTSMASPHVAGMAAMYLQANPTAAPAQVTEVLKDNATVNIVVDPFGSPNLLASRLNGTFTANGQSQYHPWAGNYQVIAEGWHHGWLRGTAGTNFDLRLWRWRSATGWQVVATAATAATNEYIVYFGTGDGAVSTFYTWEVISNATNGGVGTYDFFSMKP